MKKYSVGEKLAQIEFPEDLRNKFSLEELPQISDELRDFIVEVLSDIGNSHFGASLGVVELTVALHYVFNTPDDRIVWDVGHQAYGHKILTGRRDQFHTNRMKDGISGFPKRSESEFDPFGTGHSSTSISATLGMTLADQAQGKQRHHVAVIGDGALTGGMSFEGLNHAGSLDNDMLIILNDNCMSIDPNVGALKEYLTDITVSKTYNKVKDDVWKILGKISKFGPNAQSIASKVSRTIKGSFLKKSNFFESLNFRYFGPVDGHDVVALTQILEDLKEIKGPKILHILTKKGKGYEHSEWGDPTLWHAPGVFNKDTGEIIKVTPKSEEPPKYQDVFGHTIVELAEKNEKIMGITPAMATGCSLNFMMKAMPERTFDVGIAEQHAVTFSAGLAAEGMIPFCNIYSSFMQRAFDQIIHDVAIQNLNVVFCLDRGGLVGADGATHHGTFDLAYMRMIPNMTVCSPMNEEELRNLMYTAQLENKGPFAIRYPRGKGEMINWKTPLKEVKIGSGRKIKNGGELAILSIGPIGNEALKAIEKAEAENMSVALYDLRFVKPLDEVLLHEVFSKFDHVITVEDGCINGGMGSAVLEFMAENGYKANLVRLGVPDKFINQGSQEELWADCGYDANGILNTLYQQISLIRSKNTGRNAL
ncbi:MAG: 1-deoxy-D-xylulose-5-phosphate synthase [Crocinitomicaceae bacterium]|nr:1-deoxy-D-xylulose-5-phosphate synthase [Crocinitomicaceae bacterium]